MNAPHLHSNTIDPATAYCVSVGPPIEFGQLSDLPARELADYGMNLLKLLR